VQIDSKGIQRTIVLLLPNEYPQHAVTSEHVAMLIAALCAKAGAINIITDCMAVKLGFEKFILKGWTPGYKDVHGGFWRQVSSSQIKKVDKIKSHLTKEVGERDYPAGWWIGNNLADICANMAAQQAQASSSKELEIYRADEDKAKKGIKSVVKFLAEQPWPLYGGVEKIRQPKRDRINGQGNVNPAHIFVWSGKEDVWTCMVCNKSSRSKVAAMKKDKVGCTGSSMVAREAHHSHRLFKALGAGGENLIFCRRCAMYGTTRVVGLSKPCGSSSVNITRKKRLNGGLHPVTKAPIGRTIKIRPGVVLSPGGQSTDLEGMV
jgi:hypothetical protein